MQCGDGRRNEKEGVKDERVSINKTGIHIICEMARMENPDDVWSGCFSSFCFLLPLFYVLLVVL